MEVRPLHCCVRDETAQVISRRGASEKSRELGLESRSAIRPSPMIQIVSSPSLTTEAITHSRPCSLLQSNLKVSVNFQSL